MNKTLDLKDFSGQSLQENSWETLLLVTSLEVSCLPKLKLELRQGTEGKELIIQSLILTAGLLYVY